MKKIRLTSLFIIAGFCLNTMYAQMTGPTEKEVPGIELKTIDAQMNGPSEKWVFGLGLNIVQDDITGDNSNLATNFNTPFILSTEYLYTNYFSFNGSLSFNKYVAGKSVDNRIVQEGKDASYTAFDLSTKFYFLKLNTNYLFEPYVLGGLGYTHIGSYVAIQNNDSQLLEIPAVGRLTINTGLGVNYWFSQSWGMNMNIMGKFGIDSSEYASNQAQFSFGILYSSAKTQNWRG